ncbi:MAG: lipid-A-disaccharide synthase [Paracoccaceae bacterium]
MYKILIIAGEPSGDILGSKLIKEMKNQFQEIVNLNNSHKKELVFQGIGGPKMKNEGLTCLYRIEDLSLMGISEVISSIFKIYSIIFSLKNYTNVWKPDLIITIDSPDFCFRLVKKIRKKDKYVPIIHYVAPSVWAWRAKRAKEMSLLYDKVLALLPFEKPYFEKYGLSCDFVGHPVSKEILPNDNEQDNFFKMIKIDRSKRIISILPGSRVSEIKFMLPIYAKLIKNLSSQFDDLEFVIPSPGNVFKYLKLNIAKYKLNVKILSESEVSVEEFNSFKLSLFKLSTLAINTSGSVSLELAKMGTPMISIYKCSWFFEKILKISVKLKSANLINIILEKPVVPEFLFEKCRVHSIENSVKELLSNVTLQKNQKEAFKNVINLLSTKEKKPSEKAAKISLQYLNDEILKI